MLWVNVDIEICVFQDHILCVAVWPTVSTSAVVSMWNRMTLRDRSSPLSSSMGWYLLFFFFFLVVRKSRTPWSQSLDHSGHYPAKLLGHVAKSLKCHFTWGDAVPIHVGSTYFAPLQGGGESNHQEWESSLCGQCVPQSYNPWWAGHQLFYIGRGGTSKGSRGWSAPEESTHCQLQSI